VTKQLVAYRGGTLLTLSAHDTRNSAIDVVAPQGMTPDTIGQHDHFARHDLWTLGYIEQGLNGRTPRRRMS